MDWGMSNRINRILQPESGRTVMLAIDHGYFLGPTSGLEEPGRTVEPLLPSADSLMLTRGVLRQCIPPSSNIPVVLRISGGTSILKELSHENLAVDMNDATRLNVCALAVQVFIGGDYETQSIQNMTRLVDLGNRYGIPVLAVTAVGRESRLRAQIGEKLLELAGRSEIPVHAGCRVPVLGGNTFNFWGHEGEGILEPGEVPPVDEEHAVDALLDLFHLFVEVEDHHQGCARDAEQDDVGDQRGHQGDPRCGLHEVGSSGDAFRCLEPVPSHLAASCVGCRHRNPA